MFGKLVLMLSKIADADDCIKVLFKTILKTVCNTLLKPCISTNSKDIDAGEVMFATKMTNVDSKLEVNHTCYEFIFLSIKFEHIPDGFYKKNRIMFLVFQLV